MSRFTKKFTVLTFLILTVCFTCGCQTSAKTQEEYVINSSTKKSSKENVANSSTKQKNLTAQEFLEKVDVETKIEIGGNGAAQENKLIVEEISAGRTLENFVSKLDDQKDLNQSATREQVKEKVDTIPRYSDEILVWQFLRVDHYREVDPNKLNAYLEGKGVLSGQAETFIAAAKENDVDPIYLVAHTILETGHGSSALATGIKVDGVLTYNLWGINAYDASAVSSGSSRASKEGWTSIEASIAGGTKWIATNYIHSEEFKQTTVYKMKYNYVRGNEWHGYATDINWPDKISKIMYDMSGCYAAGTAFEYEKVYYE